MEREEYHGLVIDSEPGRSEGAFMQYCVHWFHVRQKDAEDLFPVKMSVSWHYAMKVASAWKRHLDSWQQAGPFASELAVELGRSWVHGLIDLGRFVPGEAYDEVRVEDWDAQFGEDDLSDDDLRRELLQALKRMNRAQHSTSVILALDVEGVAAVLGVGMERLRGVLGELLTEGLVEGYVETFGHTAVDGACRITGDGLRAISDTRSSGIRAAPLISVDDIDSFTKVRSVAAHEVVDLLGQKGILTIAEVQIKEAICNIVGELFDHKDWGGERSDVYTTQVRYQGRRISTAMLLKGPGVGRAVLYPADLGKRGDQDLRLFTEPAELLIVQFNGKIDSAVHERLRVQANHRASLNQATVVCVIDGVDTGRLLRAYGYL